MTLFVCATCQQHIVATGSCHTCTTKLNLNPRSLALLLGLGLIGCGDKKNADTGQDTATVEPSEEPSGTLYGVPSTEE